MQVYQSWKKLCALGAIVAFSAPMGAIAVPTRSTVSPSSSAATVTGPLLSQASPDTIALVLPDLRVRSYRFISQKEVRVVVANTGTADAAASALRLTVRRIAGTPVARQTRVGVPAIPAGQSETVIIDADHLLPVAVGLPATTFRLDADSSELVAESNEGNNLTWHNL